MPPSIIIIPHDKDEVIAATDIGAEVSAPRGVARRKSPEVLVRYFVGLDVSLEDTAICVVDDAGAIVRESKAETEPAAIAT